MRYDQLLNLISLFKPRSIIEIGTNKGDRAVLMCREAIKHRTSVTYRGYDVFDAVDEEFRKKSGFDGEECFSKSFFIEILSNPPKKFYLQNSSLIKRTSQDNMDGTSRRADLVFINGDHRSNFIRKECEIVQYSRVIVVDDYYIDAPDCTSIDKSELGCNSIVDSICNTIVFPNPDRF